jgi:hypothetical protein
VPEIAAIALKEDSVLWMEISHSNYIIQVKNAVFETLPVYINHKTVLEKSTVTTLVTFLKNLVKENNLTTDNIRLTIPSRFAMIKRVTADTSIPAENLSELVYFEFEKTWEESSQNYRVYLPEGKTLQNSDGEILAIAIRKNTLEFFDSIFNEAQLPVEVITPGCFSVEELFKAFFPKAAGQNILLGWNRRGFDATITDGQDFLNYIFRPYNIKLDPIERVSEYDLANGFSNLIFDIQNPSNLEQSVYDIQSIYNFGYYFKTEWLDFMRSRIQIPINLFNFDVTTAFQITSLDSRITPEQIFRYIEPISVII